MPPSPITYSRLSNWRAALRLDYRDAAVKRIVQLDKAQQENIVDDRTNREIGHKGRDAQEFRIFVIKKSRHQAGFAVCDEGVKKIPVESQVAEGGTVTAHSVDNQTLDVVLF